MTADQILRAMLNHPFFDADSITYDVRENEALGWDGPQVRAWIDIMHAAKQWLRENPQ